MSENKYKKELRQQLEARTEAQRQKNRSIRAAGPINKASLKAQKAAAFQAVKARKGYSVPFHLWPRELQEKEAQALRAIKFAKQAQPLNQA